MIHYLTSRADVWICSACSLNHIEVLINGWNLYIKRNLVHPKLIPTIYHLMGEVDTQTHSQHHRHCLDLLACIPMVCACWRDCFNYTRLITQRWEEEVNNSSDVSIVQKTRQTAAHSVNRGKVQSKCLHDIDTSSIACLGTYGRISEISAPPTLLSSAEI